MVKIKAAPKVRVLYARGIKAENYNYLRELAKKKGYTSMADLLNEIIEQVIKQESK